MIIDFNFLLVSKKNNIELIYKQFEWEPQECDNNDKHQVMECDLSLSFEIDNDLRIVK